MKHILLAFISSIEQDEHNKQCNLYANTLCYQLYIMKLFKTTEDGITNEMSGFVFPH